MVRMVSIVLTVRLSVTFRRKNSLAVGVPRRHYVCGNRPTGVMLIVEVRLVRQGSLL